MNTYNVYIKIETAWENIEAESEEHARNIVKDQVLDDWNIKLDDSEIIKVEVNED